jgi:hypothetical protein
VEEVQEEHQQHQLQVGKVMILFFLQSHLLAVVMEEELLVLLMFLEVLEVLVVVQEVQEVQEEQEILHLLHLHKVIMVVPGAPEEVLVAAAVVPLEEWEQGHHLLFSSAVMVV